MENNYDSALKDFEFKLLQALRNNDKKSAIILYGNLSVFENKTLSSQDHEVRSLGYKAQNIKEKLFDFLML